VICGDGLIKSEDRRCQCQCSRALPRVAEFIIRLVFVVHTLTSIANLRSVRHHLFSSNRFLIFPISRLVLVMTEDQVNMPVDSCYQVKCDDCGKTTWKVNYFFLCVL